MEEIEESRGGIQVDGEKGKRVHEREKVKHGKEKKLVYLGAYVATRFRDTGLESCTKAMG